MLPSLDVKRVRDYDDVIQEDKTNGQMKITQTLFHESLIRCRCVCQTHSHPIILEEAKGCYSEYSCFLVFFRKFNLMVATLHV